MEQPKTIGGVSLPLEDASGAQRQEYTTPTCQLFARKTEARVGRRHVYLYDVLLDGDLAIKDSPDPNPI